MPSPLASSADANGSDSDSNGSSNRNSTTGGDGNAALDYVVFAVADGSGSGPVTFTLPDAVSGTIKTVITEPSPFSGGLPARAVAVEGNRRAWVDSVYDMQMIAYRVAFQ